jgi:hypothetical protein
MTGRIGGGFALLCTLLIFWLGVIIFNEVLEGRILVFPHRLARVADIGGRANEA